MNKESLQPDEDLSRPASVLARRFIQRWDCYARQLEDGRYVCIHEALSPSHLYAHLRGEITLGTYLLDKESRARFVVLDNDATEGWSALLECAARLANEGIPAYLEKSRRGGHLWLFFVRPIDGDAARCFVRDKIVAEDLKAMELYPKQDTIGEGMGSLIRLPFGVHRLTGRRYGFYGYDGVPLGGTIREQMNALLTPQFVSEALLEPYTMISSSSTPTGPRKRLGDARGPVSERIKTRVTVLEFIGRYVDLRRTESGAVGLCPFHDDQHPSFGVNDKENYWNCFAGCGGGSIIDFWSLWRKKQGLDPSFVATITELAEMLF